MPESKKEMASERCALIEVRRAEIALLRLEAQSRCGDQFQWCVPIRHEATSNVPLRYAASKYFASATSSQLVYRVEIGGLQHRSARAWSVPDRYEGFLQSAGEKHRWFLAQTTLRA